MFPSTLPLITAAAPGVEARLSMADVFHCDDVLRLEACHDKASAIRQLVDQLVQSHRLADRYASQVIAEIHQREGFASTAFGRGFAFPHLRTPFTQAFIGAIGMIPAGLCFDANDRQNTKLIFLILSPLNERREHTELLSRLVSLLGNTAVTLRMMQCDQASALHQTLCALA